MAALGIIYSERKLTTLLLEEQKIRGSGLSKTAASFASEPLLSKDYPVLTTYAKTMVLENELEWMSIENKDGVKVASYPINKGETEFKEHEVFSFPIQIDNLHKIGKVRLIISTQAAQEKIAQITSRVIFYTTLAIILFSILLIIVLHFLIAKPVHKLAKEAIRLGEGQLNDPIPIKGNDEIATLSITLDKMRIGILSITDSLKDQYVELERLALVKDEFLTNMSHELKTPLNGITASLDLLEPDNLAEDQIELINTIRYSSKSLTSILEAIIDFTLLQGKKLKIEEEVFNPKTLIQDSIDEALEEIDLGQNNVIIESSPEMAQDFIGDCHFLHKVLRRILNNSFKFTENGEITVSFTESETQGHYTFRVTDTGTGIPRNKLPLIFNKFTQIDQSTTKKFAGVGMGLTLCKKMIESLGGEINVESTEGEGTQVEFSIPLKLSPPSESPVNSNPQMSSAQNTHSAESQSVQPQDCLPVLLVEDNPVNQMVTMRLLETLGFTVELAENGVEAVNSFKTTSFEAILMDLSMPEMDGFEATIQIRSIEDQEDHTPIIAVTANTLDSDRQRCFEIGMDDFLGKPINKKVLSNALCKWTRVSQL